MLGEVEGLPAFLTNTRATIEHTKPVPFAAV
ncbi:hypothetical protein HNR07_005503 [Nocardiopsis metallicus]|uniref:Uncharacterized protein n=1 Tax=Nocardiopsis metallicus TaxID=179819 RepID=A0A840WRT8_9ACTN|nr:hypothetical protein [Nocardiopsis metallicus]